MTTETTGWATTGNRICLQERRDVLFIQDRDRDERLGRLRHRALPTLIAGGSPEEPARHAEPKILDRPSVVAGDGQALVDATEGVLGPDRGVILDVAGPPPGATNRRREASVRVPHAPSIRQTWRKRLANDR